jgi:hypothetical protein
MNWVLDTLNLYFSDYWPPNPKLYGVVVILIVDHGKKILVTANDFGSSKTNPGQRPKHHFCCGDMGKKVKYHKRGDLGK